MKRRTLIGFLILIILAVWAGVIAWPQTQSLDFSKIKLNYQRDVQLRLGLDLQGGTHLVYEADLSKISPEDKSRAVEGAVEVIRKRVDAFGVSEPVIQSSEIGGKSRVIVELPGIKNISQAVSLIGKTAQLEFYRQEGEGEKASWQPTGLTGAHLKRSETQTNPQTGGIEVALEFNEEGKNLFAKITKENLEKPVAIVLDGKVISAPTVQSVIEDGKAVITGNFDLESARQLAIQLNAGALPVPLELVEQTNVGATLGQESVKKSILAGIIGFVLVILYIVIYYRFLGIVGGINLVLYGAFVMSIFKLVPVTLTLAGIAGFILSVGMALEANILFFERLREELRGGRSYASAVESGFRGAWSSIWDSNVVSFIISLVLYWLGTGMVIGFALTLMIGIGVSLILVAYFTRPLLLILKNTPLVRYKWFFAVKIRNQGNV